MDEETNRLLQELLNAVQQSGGRQTPAVAAANKAYQAQVQLLGKGNTQEGKRQSLTSKAMAATSKAVTSSLNVAKSLENASTALRENRESFASLNPSIEMAGQSLKFAGKIGGIAAEGLGSLASGIPVVGGAIDGLGKAAGKAMAALGEMAGEVVSAVGKTFTAELDRINGAFRTIAQTGALGAEGMTGLGKQAINAGLSFNAFAKVVSKESETLAFAFGTSADAARGLSDTTKAMRPFREQLLTLGIGVEQQNELTAKYIQFQQRQGRNEINNTRALAEGSQAYMKNLQTLSKITGKSIEESQKEIDAVQRDVRQGAAIREIERKNGKDAAQATLNTITTLNSIPGLKSIGDGLADALSNAGTPAAQEFLKVMGPVGNQVVSQLKSGAIDTNTALKMIQDQGKNFYQGLGGDQFAASAGKMGTSIEAVLPALQTLSLTKDLGAAAEKAAVQTTKLANTEDKLTKDVVSAQESMIAAATELDKFALQTILPAASDAVKAFTKVQLDMLVKMNEYMDVLSKEGLEGLKNALKKDIDAATGGKVDKVGNAMKGAAALGLSGAAIGTVIAGPIGTAVGGGIGMLVGALTGYFSSGGDKNKAKVDGKLADGGAAEAGRNYLVGEEGPEILKMGKTSGVVIPGQIGPGVPGRVPGTFDVKLGDGSVVTVDAKGQELYRKGPRIGGLQQSTSADGTVSSNLQSILTMDGGSVNYTQDNIMGQKAGFGMSSGPFSMYQSGGAAGTGVGSMNYAEVNSALQYTGSTLAQSGASGGNLDALGQLRSVAGPKFGDTGGLAMNVNEADKLAYDDGMVGKEKVMTGDGGENTAIMKQLMEMINTNQQKQVRLQEEQLQVQRNG